MSESHPPLLGVHRLVSCVSAIWRAVTRRKRRSIVFVAPSLELQLFTDQAEPFDFGSQRELLPRDAITGVVVPLDQLDCRYRAAMEAYQRGTERCVLLDYLPEGKVA